MQSKYEKLIYIPRTLLLGVAQVMLQPSVFVGAVFFIGLLINSVPLALCGLLGCFFGSIMGYLPGMIEDERTQGLYGFNGVLLGIALAYFYEVDWMILAAIVIGGCCTTFVMRGMLYLKLTPLTFPFIVVTWIFMWILGLIGVDRSPSLLEATNTISVPIALTFGYGQVMFQENILTGILFLFALTWRDRTQGTHTFVAVLLGIAVGIIFGFPKALINLGLYGYNGVLCAIVFAGTKKSDWIWSIAAILFSILITRVIHVSEFDPHTFPFVLSSWVFLYLRKHINLGFSK